MLLAGIYLLEGGNTFLKMYDLEPQKHQPRGWSFLICFCVYQVPAGICLLKTNFAISSTERTERLVLSNVLL